MFNLKNDNGILKNGEIDHSSQEYAKVLTCVKSGQQNRQHHSNLGNPKQSLQSSTVLNSTTIAVFFLTAPHEEENRGDTDYLKAVIRGIETIKHDNIELKLEYINGRSRYEDNELYNPEVLYQRGKTSNQKYKEGGDEERKLAISRIKNCIKTRIDNFNSPYTSNSILSVLHLQLRAPETGCMIHPEDIIGLKEVINKFVITCHEWKHNENSVGARKNQIQQLEYMQYADHIIFLNQADMDDAVQATKDGCLTRGNETETCKKIDGFENKTSTSNISATLPIAHNFQFNIDVFLKRPPNILVFGLMRRDKGFEQGLELAEYIKVNGTKIRGQTPRICFAGSPHDLSIARKIIASKWWEKSADGIRQLSYSKEETDRYIKEYKNDKAIDCLVKWLNDCGKRASDAVIREIIEANRLTEAGKKIAKHYCEEDRDYSAKKTEIEKIIKEINDEPIPDAYREEKQKAFLMKKYKEQQEQQEYRDIDIEFNVDAVKLDELSTKYKYCYKVEKKGFANNSSSIINTLNRGLITFSNSSAMTSEGFLSGDYRNAIIFLWEHETKFEEIKPELLVKEIQQREDDIQQQKNRETLNALSNAIKGLFNEEKIGRDHWQIYTKLQQSNGTYR